MRSTRYPLLLASLLFHAGLLFLLTRLHFFGDVAPPAKPDLKADFVVVVPAPPPPPAAGPPTRASLAPAASSASVGLPTVAPVLTATAAPTLFNLPVTGRSTLDSMTRALGDLLSAEGRTPGGGGGGAVNLGGVAVPDDERLGVVLDVSGSMTSILTPIRQALLDHFPGCPVFEADDSLGHYVQREEHAATPDPDLYFGCYNLLAQNVTAIYLFSDFEDGEEPRATLALVEDLREAHVKLYICYTEGAPYDELARYARESGGEAAPFKPSP